MNKERLFEYLKDFPDDADIALSQYTCCDEEDEFHIVFDIPIIGIAYDKETNEIRFVCSKSSQKSLENFEETITRL